MTQMFMLQKANLKLLLTLIAMVIGFNAFALEPMPADTNKLSKDGKKQGLWRERVEQVNYEGNYINDKKEGVWIGYFVNDGQPQSGKITIHHFQYNVYSVEEYRNGKKNGMAIILDYKGYINERKNYTNDTLDGLSVTYFPGGKIRSRTEYKMGKLHGVSANYYNDGRLKDEITFKNNVRDGVSRWYYPKQDLSLEDGGVSIEYNYKNGLLEGPMKMYYRYSSKLESVVNAINNMEEGEYRAYYESGKDKMVGNYIHGKKEGKWIEYAEDGKIITTEMYKDGELVK